MEQTDDKGFQLFIKIFSEIAPKWFNLLGWIIIISLYTALLGSTESSLFIIIIGIILAISFVFIFVQIIALWALTFARFAVKLEGSKPTLFVLFTLFVALLIFVSFYIVTEVSLIITKFTLSGNN